MLRVSRCKLRVEMIRVKTLVAVYREITARALSGMRRRRWEEGRVGGGRGGVRKRKGGRRKGEAELERRSRERRSRGRRKEK